MGNINESENKNNRELKDKYQKVIDEIILSFKFQNIYDSIEDVFATGRYDITPVRFFKSEVFPVNNKLKISNDFSDVIVAFYSTKEIILKISYKNNEITHHKIPANGIYLPYSNFIPICCLENGDIEIEILTDYKELYIIYGILSNDMYEYLINNLIYTAIFNGEKEIHLAYFDNKLYIDSQIPEHNVDIIKLPSLYIETEKYRKYNANKVTEQIREELLKIAMNPNRISSFMAIDDLKRYNIL